MFFSLIVGLFYRYNDRLPSKSALLLIFFASGSLFTVVLQSQGYNAAYYTYLSELRIAEAPRQFSDSIIFSYRAPHREQYSLSSIGIAFSHEHYRVVHQMRRNEYGVYFFVMNRRIIPYDILHIEYRLIVNGIWRDDPANPQMRLDRSGAKFSQLQLTTEERELTSPNITRGRAEFIFSPHEQATLTLTEIDGSRIYFSRDERLQVHVAGSFNGWDPFLAPMNPDRERPGQYRISLPLASGDHYYYYVVNGQRILDPHNSNVVTSVDGHRASVVTIE